MNPDVAIAKIQAKSAREARMFDLAKDLAKHPVVEIIGMVLFLGWATDVTNFPKQGQPMISDFVANSIGATAGAAIIAQQLAPSMPYVMDSANKLLGPAIAAGTLALAAPK